MSAADPAAHDFGGQPMPADFCFFDDRHAVAAPQRVGSAGKQERGGIGVEWFASLNMTIVFDINGVAQKGPAVPAVVFDIVTSVEQVS
ncbi:hypothetical protein [Amycolatopsis sp. NBC_00438]|uniref:hypothetical protein n=1 Tax=Amycolatopsis sp. NBC_00438 TaxID=2903558 RepID=UPI002E240E14